MEIDNLIEYKNFSNGEIDDKVYGYSIVIDHLCMLVLSSDKTGDITINLPYNFTRNTFFTITDNDMNLGSYAYRDLRVSWVSNNRITYTGTHAGHTLLIVGYIN